MHRLRRISVILNPMIGAYVLGYLYFTEGGIQGIGKWIFPTGIVGVILLILGIRVVIREMRKGRAK
jgi:hypothetical protein